MSTAHEQSDVNVGLLVRIFFVLAGSLAMTVVVVLGCWWLLRSFDTGSVSRFALPRELPPRPRLQASPELDLQQMLEHDLGQLNSYGRTEEGRFHMPIQRAMDMIVQRGLPVRQQTPPPIGGDRKQETANEPAVH